MSDNKTMIRFYSLFLLIFSLLTYAVDLNAQHGFVVINSPLVSHSFCFAILSGILTGVIVALAAEIRQYMMHKRQARSALYAIASELYALISVQKASLKYYINNPNIPIPENIGGDFARQPILDRVLQFRAIDYSTFSTQDTIRFALNTFGHHLNLIERSIRSLTGLRIARNCVQLSFGENCDVKSKVTASLPLMLNALHEEHDALNDCFVAIDSFCASFERLDSVRFEWNCGKKVIDDMCKRIEVDIHCELG